MRALTVGLSLAGGVILLFGGGTLTIKEATAGTAPLHVAAAADLMGVLPPLVRQFEQISKIPVRLSWGSTGEESLSIRHGAPYDFFMAADSRTPASLARDGFLVKQSLRIYARGVLVLFLREKALREGTLSPSESALESPSVKRFAIPNPRLAPYGRSALACLKKRGLWPGLRKKAVFGSSLAQVGQYVRSGSVDAAFLSLSLSMNLKKSGIKGATIHLVPGCASSLDQTMGIVTRSKHRQAAERLEEFLSSPAAKKYLLANGYH